MACVLLAFQAGADCGLRCDTVDGDPCIGKFRGLKSIILFRRLPVETFVFVETRFVLFSIFEFEIGRLFVAIVLAVEEDAAAAVVAAADAAVGIEAATNDLLGISLLVFFT